MYAPVYDRIFGTIYARARRRAVELLALQRGERLFIPGVGTGLDLPLLPAGVEVTGVDLSREMLGQVRSKDWGISLRLYRMDAQQLDLPAESYDAALLNLIVSVAPDGAAVAREAWRVLKPGGRMVIFDKFAPEGHPLSPARRALGKIALGLGTDINRRLSEVLGEIDGYVVESDAPAWLGGTYRILRLRKVEQPVSAPAPGLFDVVGQHGLLMGFF
jgi:ubiquinone/menaquinone biosynthesis C-methylase UbiE